MELVVCFNGFRKGIILQIEVKMNHLFTLMTFQILMAYFPLWNTKGEVWKNRRAPFYTMKVELSSSKRTKSIRQNKSLMV